VREHEPTDAEELRALFWSACEVRVRRAREGRYDTVRAGWRRAEEAALERLQAPADDDPLVATLAREERAMLAEVLGALSPRERAVVAVKWPGGSARWEPRRPTGATKGEGTCSSALKQTSTEARSRRSRFPRSRLGSAGASAVATGPRCPAWRSCRPAPMRHRRHPSHAQYLEHGASTRQQGVHRAYLRGAATNKNESRALGASEIGHAAGWSAARPFPWRSIAISSMNSEQDSDPYALQATTTVRASGGSLHRPSVQPDDGVRTLTRSCSCRTDGADPGVLPEPGAGPVGVRFDPASGSRIFAAVGRGATCVGREASEP
jgi:hypothetical protein